MDKRELRKIPALRATPQDTSLAKRVSGAKYIAKSEVRICAHKKHCFCIFSAHRNCASEK